MELEAKNPKEWTKHHLEPYRGTASLIDKWKTMLITVNGGNRLSRKNPKTSTVIQRAISELKIPDGKQSERKESPEHRERGKRLDKRPTLGLGNGIK